MSTNLCVVTLHDCTLCIHSIGSSSITLFVLHGALLIWTLFFLCSTTAMTTAMRLLRHRRLRQAHPSTTTHSTAHSTCEELACDGASLPRKHNTHPQLVNADIEHPIFTLNLNYVRHPCTLQGFQVAWQDIWYSYFEAFKDFAVHTIYIPFIRYVLTRVSFTQPPTRSHLVSESPAECSVL